MPPTTSVTDEIVDVVRIADGDFAEPRDMMAVQSQAQRRAWTELMGALGQAPWHPAISGTLPACRTIGDALEPQFSGADVSVSPGSFFFATTADPGQPTPFALLHTVAATKAVATASANASGSDRQDLLTVKVARLVTNAADNATRIGKLLSGQKVSRSTPHRYRTELTLGYYEGTPGAGDPAIDAGEVTIARYTMRAGQAAFIASDVTDLRVALDMVVGDLTASGDIDGATVTTAEGGVRHGANPLILGASLMQADTVWAFAAINTAVEFEPQWVHNAASNDNLIASIPLAVGERITAVTVRFKLDTATAGSVTVRLYKSDASTGTVTAMSDLASAAADTARQSLSLANITAEDQAAGTRWFLVFQAAANIVIRVYCAEVTTTRA